MTASFRKILIPVDFSLNTEIAVKKAIGFIDAEDAFIHLMHAIRPGNSAGHKHITRKAEIQLAAWKEVIEDAKPGLKAMGLGVTTSIRRGRSVQQEIIESAHMMEPDLIIIGKNGGRRNWFYRQSLSPDRIAAKTNCPVLTVKAGSLAGRTKIIVIPVRHFVPQRKLELAILIARKYKAQIHLLAIRENVREDKEALSRIFVRTYHQLREKLHNPIGYFSVSRHNTARAALHYAEFIMADMILVNPASESGVSSLAGSRHISDLMDRDSKIQILDVNPYE